MKSNHIEYDFEKSRKRIDEILNTSDTAYEELDNIPSRDKLTFTNGFYVYCSALFVDIRKSSELPEIYKRPTLARIYRCYISEVVAIMNRDSDCSEINIDGDCIWGIFNTKYKQYFDYLFETSAMISSIIDILNCRLKVKGIEPISVGIGLDYGRALMIKAGYEGSGINEVVWMGEVVNSASELSSYGNKTYLDNETMISDVFYSNLKEDYKKLSEWNETRKCWHGNIIDIGMNEWYKENCK